jgi:long-chain acyl-CoA synthetase
MNTFVSFNSYIEKSIKQNWNLDALTDYQGITLQYHDVARKIEKLHILFENSNVKEGDKIAICGRNSANWAVVFLATLTYGAVAVPVQNEFSAEQIYNVVNHSEAKLLFVGDYVVKAINADEMPALEGVIFIPDLSLVMSRSETLIHAREHLNLMFGSKYPNAFRANDVTYHKDEADETAIINYTSGTTGFSKGVMIPYRAICGNLEYCIKMLGEHVPHGSSTLNMLPMAHMYGMAFEFFFPFVHGCHLSFLTRLPSPAVIAQAIAEVKPYVIVAVPLVVEKIIRKQVFPLIDSNVIKMLLKMPVVNKKVKERICELVKTIFGGNAYEVIVGGAPLNQEIEDFLVSIGFPITVGYGTTECAPLISFSDYHDFVPGSCGTPVDNMEVKILSSRPQVIPGEIVAKGKNVMLGYYKNEEKTRATIDEDGWYHTGDLGTMSADGHIFIKGRKKNMLLGANGQNIYPEEIEDKLGSMALVSECIVIQRGEKIIALVHPDYDEATAMNFSTSDLQGIMEQNRKVLNAELPTFSRLAAIEIQEEEFAKTPKKSIKRYLYN